MVRALPVLTLFAVLSIAACGGPTYQRVQLVNATERTIESIYIFPPGSVQRGASRATLAPKATAEAKVATGNIEVLAISEPVRIDETTRETREASQILELKGPLQIVFHDSNQPPPVDRPGTRAITFRVASSPPAPAPPAPGEDTP